MKSDMNPRRLAIYATYDKDGWMDEYIIFCLKALHKMADDIVVVSNHQLMDEVKNRISSEVYMIYERDDNGYDMGGFADVIKKLYAQQRLDEYDEIIFMNDSVFGPFYPLEEMFAKMSRENELDFWGITKRGESDFDGGEAIYPEHIQLYFFVVKSRMLHSNDFIEYWRGITRKVTDFRSAILNYEFAFTQYFAEKGYKWAVYCQTNEYITENPKFNLSPYHYCTYELIKDKKCPLLKRKLFTGDFIEGEFTDKSDLRKAIEYIANSTEYDINLIWDHILRVYPLREICDAMQMTELIDCEQEGETYEKLPVKILEKHDFFSKTYGIAGCDEADYILYLHFEQNGIPSVLRRAEMEHVKENLLHNRNYIKQVLRLFKQDARLGVVVPPMCTFGGVSKSIEKKWMDEKKCCQIAGKYQFTIPVGDKAPIPRVCGFICRREILTKELINEIESDNTGTAIQMVPLFAQQKGYYTKTIINTSYGTGLFVNMQEMLYNIYNMQDVNMNKDSNLQEVQNRVYKQKIEEFVGEKKNVYIYGAGQLACRIIKILEDIIRPKGIVVSDKNGNADCIYGYAVNQVDEIECEDSCFIVAVGEKNNNIVEKKLQSAGVKDYMLLR